MPELHRYDWTHLHGDSDESPWFALITALGEPIDLTNATMRAQVRDRTGAPVHFFLPGVGILVGSATVQRPGHDPVDTAAVRLAIAFAESEALPRKLRDGAFDLEITRDGKRRTVLGGRFDVIEDVTR